MASSLVAASRRPAAGTRPPAASPPSPTAGHEETLLIELTGPVGCDDLDHFTGYPGDERYTGTRQQVGQAVRDGATDQRVDAQSADRPGSLQRTRVSQIDLTPPDIPVLAVPDEKNARRCVEHR